MKTDIKGLLYGHAQDTNEARGCTCAWRRFFVFFFLKKMFVSTNFNWIFLKNIKFVFRINFCKYNVDIYGL